MPAKRKPHYWGAPRSVCEQTALLHSVVANAPPFAEREMLAYMSPMGAVPRERNGNDRAIAVKTLRQASCVVKETGKLSRAKMWERMARYVRMCVYVWCMRGASLLVVAHHLAHHGELRSNY